MNMKEIQEIWRPIVGYEDQYEVSDLGNVKSIDRLDSKGRFRKGRMLSKNKIRDYNQVYLCKNAKTKGKKVYRLVAMAFPEICGDWFDGAEIDHINTEANDDRAVNLRVCTHKENCQNPLTREHYSSSMKMRYKDNSIRNKYAKPVNQLTKDGIIVKTYESISQASRDTGINKAHIASCSQGSTIRKSAGGYRWTYS